MWREMVDWVGALFGMAREVQEQRAITRVLERRSAAMGVTCREQSVGVIEFDGIDTAMMRETALLRFAMAAI